MPAWLGMSTPSPCWPFQKAQDKQREWAALTHLTTMGEKLERRSKQPNFFSFLRHWGGVLIFMGLVPQPALSLCLASFQWGFALLFPPPQSENVVWFCKCCIFQTVFFLVWVCVGGDESAFGHTTCSSMVTLEKINPFIKKAWPGSSHRLARDSSIPLISRLWRNY